MRSIFFLILFAGLQFTAQAFMQQDNNLAIKGKVSDSSGNPLSGASITIENSTIGVLSGAGGNYFLPVRKRGTYLIRFSFIGFEPQTREITLNDNLILDITLAAKPFMTDEVFVNATRAGENSPLAYSTVTREEISEANVSQDIPYILNFTPSLVVSSDAGTGVGYTNINIRGTDVKRINVTIDGIPVNDAESHGVWWVDLPDLASSSDNIQIQRGVGTSTNGAGAFGATINFQSEALNTEPYAEINSSYGSFNTSKNTINFGTGLINKKIAFDVRLSKIWSDGYIDRAFSDLKSFYISGTVCGEKSLLKLMVFSGVEHTYQAWDGVPKDSLRTHRTYNPYNYANETDNYWQDNYQLHYSKEVNSNINVNLALHYTRGKGYYENRVQDAAFSSYNLPDAVFNSDTVSISDFITRRWLKNDFYGFTYSLNYNRSKFTAVMGGGWNHYLGNHFGDIIWAGIVTYPGEIYRWYQGTGNKKDLNTFLKMNYSLTDKFNLYADLQVRNIDYIIGGFDENLKNVAQKHIYNFFNPKAGFVYNFSEGQKIYASLGISQREPDRGNFTDADPGIIPKPEKLFDYEAGYDFKSTKIKLKANLYYMNYINQLILTGKINNVGAAILTNVPKSYREGIEIETELHISPNLNWYENFTVSRNIIPVFTDYTDNWDTYTQNEKILTDKTISFSPSIIAGSVIDFRPFNRFHISWNTKYVGRQYIDNTQNYDRMLKAYTVQNVSFLYLVQNKFLKKISIQLVINNLFNTKYETNAWVYKYYEGGSMHEMDGYFPQAGLNYMFRVGLKF